MTIKLYSFCLLCIFAWTLILNLLLFTETSTFWMFLMLLILLERVDIEDKRFRLGDWLPYIITLTCIKDVALVNALE